MYTDEEKAKKKTRALINILAVALAVVAVVMLCSNRRMDRYRVTKDDFIEVTAIQFPEPVHVWRATQARYEICSQFPKIYVAFCGDVVTIHLYYAAEKYHTLYAGMNEVIIYHEYNEYRNE